MLKDTFDKLHWLLLAATLLVLIAILASGTPDPQLREGKGQDKVMEREMAYQAKVALLHNLFGPVEDLRKKGDLPTALLKLGELNRKYPGEAHGFILQAEIQHDMGALDESVASFVEGLRLNGEYLDAKSPLSRRDELQKIVAETQRDISKRSAANPDNRSLTRTINNINYLRSRLAGGCE